MKTIYVFSGLGADERVFYKLNFGNYNVVHIKWIQPQLQESIEAYAAKLLPQIATEAPVLLGLSFGGMMAVEVSKQIATEKVILISSAKSKNEIPLFYKIAGKVKLHKLIYPQLLINANVLTNWLFSNRSKHDKKLLSQVIKETDLLFLKWAIDKIVNWKNTEIPANLFHIHGSADKILPFKNVKSPLKINNGSHLMVITQHNEVNEALSQLLIC